MTSSELHEADFGVLERAADAVTLRFVRRLPHPPQKVWRALTEPAHLAAWFPTTIDGDMTAGSTLKFEFPDMDVPGFDGTMLTFDPPRLLEFVWGDERLRFELEADGNGTMLRFAATFDELGRAARDAAGWHTCLDLLGYDVAEYTAPYTSDDRWRVVIGPYQERFGPEASTIGPPQEWEDNYGLT